MAAKKKKVALVYDTIYPYIKGGGERRFYEFGKRLSQHGFEVHLYGMKLWNGPNVIQKDGMYLHGICKARPLYTKSGRRSASQAITFGISCFKLFREEFDVIDCCGFPYFSLFPAKLVAMTRRKPLHATWYEVWGKQYWNEYLGILGFLGYAIEKVASKLPTHIIAVSRLTEQKLREELSVKRHITVIPYGIDTKELELSTPLEETCDLLFVGRLLEHKNIDHIILVIEKLLGKGIMLKCRIVGAGPMRKSLEVLAINKKVDHLITWTGSLKTSTEVLNHMKSTKVLILPSRREGLGMVVLEANACGVPVITFNHEENAARWLIASGKNGYVYSNLEELSEYIIQVLGRYKSMQEECLITSSQYNFPKLAAALATAYNENSLA